MYQQLSQIVARERIGDLQREVPRYRRVRATSSLTKTNDSARVTVDLSGRSLLRRDPRGSTG
jgi:hypothetical protein